MSGNALMKLAITGEMDDAMALMLMEQQEDDNAYIPVPAKIKIAPGGINQFIFGDETVKSFTAVVLISQIIRGYWPQGGGSNIPPLCSSPDGKRGIFADNPDAAQLAAAEAQHTLHPALSFVQKGEPAPSFDCKQFCPLSQWGSGKGRGKACKEMRRLLVLPEGWTAPALMSLPPTSLRIWDTYCSTLATKGSAYFGVRTTFALEGAKSEGGDPYSYIKLTLGESFAKDKDMVGAVSEVRRQYRELVSSLNVEADEYNTIDGNGSTDDDTPF